MNQPWPVHDRFLELHSRWLTLVGEHLQDPTGQILEYWRVEKADSVVVLPIQGSDLTDPESQHILLPCPSYRPGIGQVTLDFPGGRLLKGQDPKQAAIAILARELGIDAGAIEQLTLLNTQGWAVNSSFSNQTLFGFVAHIHSTATLSPQYGTVTYPITLEGIQDLLQSLTCLQCRAVFLEWFLRFKS